MHDFGLQLMIIGLAGFAAQWAAWRMHVPAIVFLLVTGFLFGPVLHVVRPDEMLGDFMRPAIGVAVAIILFEASLNLDFREISGVRRSIWQIVLLGAPLGWLLLSCGGHYIGGLSWPTAATFGGLLVVTGPTVIIPLLRSARLTPRVNSILKWEGIVNDPLGVLFAVLAYEYFVTVQSPDAVIDAGFYLHIAGVLGVTVLVSVACGWGISRVFDRGWVPEYLKSYFMLIVVVALFTLCNQMIEEMGLVAVTTLGVTLANMRVSSIEDIRRFKEVVTLLLVSGVFILLTADLNPAVLLDISFRGLLFMIVLLLVLRPLTIFAAALGTDMTTKEKLFVSLIAPRGVVCAAIAGVMGPKLAESGFADGEQLLPLAFGIVLVTVIAHSVAAKPLARKLGLATEAANGLIIVGATSWSTALAEILHARDIPVLIADQNWHRLRQARQAGLPTYYGQILSEEAQYSIEFSHYGTLLAATENDLYNTLLCSTLAPDFGRENVWQLAEIADNAHERHVLSHTLHGRIFAAKDLYFETLWQRMIEGYRFKATRVGPDSAAAGEAGLMTEGDIKVGVIQNGKLRLRAADQDVTAKEGDILITLAKPKPAAPARGGEAA